MSLPVKQHTEVELARAYDKGKMIGWLQAGAVVVAGGILFNLLGWIIPVLAVGGVGWLGYKWMTRASDDEGTDAPE